MFGAYPQIASYMQAAGEAAIQNEVLYQEPLPTYLRPIFQPQQSWSQRRGKHGLTEDFIMVAEFSELEGPKPLMTIPKDGGANFDQNAFSVRILAVDCQSSAEGVSVSEDAQIVMSDTTTGVFAFVHHLVLYDNTARGFVRPYCIAYITTDQRKLMFCYEDLSFQFKKAARYLKYGNKMLFVGDLERHLRDLEYTKNFLLNQVSKIRLKNMTESNSQVTGVRKNAENELYKALHMIQESNMEIKQTLSIFKPLLQDRRLEARFKSLEERAFQRSSPASHDHLSLHDDWFNDMPALDKLNMKCGHLKEQRMSLLSLFKPREYKPVLVKTKKAKRFNAPLRGLHELCSWGAKEGMRKLTHIHEYFMRDMAMLELEKTESRLFYPSNISISHGQCVTGNFLSEVHIKRSKVDTTGEIENCGSMLYSYHCGSLGSLTSLNSFKSAYSGSSLYGLQGDSSPSSYHTYESQSANAFQSDPPSPEKEFSLLKNHEYYPGMDEDIACEISMDSFNLIQDGENDEDEDIEKTLIAESSGCNQEHVNILSEFSSENTTVVDNLEDIRMLSQADDKFESGHNVDLNNKSSIISDISPSDLNLSEESNGINISVGREIDEVEGITHLLLENDILMKDNCEAPELIKESLVKTSNFYMEDSNVEDLNACGDSQRSSDKALSLANSDTQSLSKYSHISGKFSSTETSTKSYIKSGRQILHVSEQMKSQSYNDHTTSQDNQQQLSGSINGYPTNQNKKDELLSLVKIEEIETIKSSENFELPSSVYFPEDLLIDSKIANIVSSSWILTNGGEFAKKLVQMTSQDSIKNNSASKLSNLLSHDNHLVTEQTHSQDGNVIQTGASNEISFQRVRSDSDVSSVFTASSAQDLYQYLINPGNGYSNTTHNLQRLSERCETAVTEDEYFGIPSSKTTGVWKPSRGVYTVGDWINNLTFGRPGVGLSEVLSNYQKIEHVIFSVLCGRPVLVVGPARLEQEVVKLVNALAVFVPRAGRKQQTVIEWTSQCLRITDLINLRLVGMCRPERRSVDSFIPSAIKRASTVVDIEKRIITAPPYQGQFIITLLSKRKVFQSDIQMLSYTQWWLMDILSKAFLFFHSFCLGSTGSILYSHNPKDQRDAYCATVSAIMIKLGVKDHDCEIIEYLTEIVKMSELEPHVWSDADSGNVVHPLSLQYKFCEQFRC